jgi:hypothetical protein
MCGNDQPRAAGEDNHRGYPPDKPSGGTPREVLRRKSKKELREEAEARGVSKDMIDKYMSTPEYRKYSGCMRVLEPPTAGTATTRSTKRSSSSTSSAAPRRARARTAELLPSGHAALRALRYSG